MGQIFTFLAAPCANQDGLRPNLVWYMGPIRGICISEMVDLGCLGKIFSKEDTIFENVGVATVRPPFQGKGGSEKNFNPIFGISTKNYV